MLYILLTHKVILGHALYILAGSYQNNQKSETYTNALYCMDIYKLGTYPETVYLHTECIFFQSIMGVSQSNLYIPVTQTVCIYIPAISKQFRLYIYMEYLLAAHDGCTLV